jgi:hypothetical protein
MIMPAIAMWSGPRNLSTALMRSFGNRADTTVIDEPLYAFYLDASGLDHPARDEVLESQSRDWRVVVAGLVQPRETPIYYQKHMTHHVLPQIDLDRLRPLTHAFLIRQPRLVLASYAKVREEPTLEDLGLPQQVELFRAFGGPVVDATELARSPEQVLRGLCDSLGIDFDPAMLHWPTGPRDTDGVWAPHWYDGVWASTSFTPPRESAELPDRLLPLLERCQPYYDELHAAMRQ